MSAHDPLCLCEQCIDHDPLLDGIERYDEVSASPDGPFVLFSDLPDLIARVRKDERGKVLMELRPNLHVADMQGYRRALRDAIDAVKALPYVRPAYYGKGVLIHGAEPDFVRSDVVAAIEALRGER